MKFTLYGDDKTGISIHVDPIIKKDIRLEFRYELGAVEIPTGDEQSFSTGSDDASVGFTDDSNSFYDDAIVGSADVFDVFV